MASSQSLKSFRFGVLEICGAGVLGLRIAYSARPQGDNRNTDRRDEPHINWEREYCSPEYIQNKINVHLQDSLSILDIIFMFRFDLYVAILILIDLSLANFTLLLSPTFMPFH